MTYPAEFESIRPFVDEELPAAMQRIVSHPTFPSVAKFIYPNEPVEQVARRLLALRTIKDFQLHTMRDILQRVIKQSITEFSWEGTEYLQPGKSYLFVSNHRDIVLDAFLLQQILDGIGMPPCHITFGANLMQHPMIIDAGKCNKMFRVDRGGSLKSFYHSLKLVSSYIRFVISTLNESVWIAQRNGRTKDGIDGTEASLIKMFAMSGEEDDLTNLETLNIVPVSVSYEWEPCDSLKAIELSLRQNGNYQKAPDEDLRSILTGIRQPKGRTHIAINKPITKDDLLAYSRKDGDFYKWVASLIDRRILSGYKLYPNNYIAHDFRDKGNRFAQYYTPYEKTQFMERLQQIMSNPNFDQKAKMIYIGIYANPVDSSII
ncbi:MAG: 1-acyl-sn-glycerol-3-phosphate acyltransferase [Bacteroidales bacterium]|nr:1-acyl-sn-glycerol-3-phosphate acyltransferase [Bacteroidales bacterium]